MFSKYGKDFLANIFEGRPLSDRNGGGHIDSNAPAGARRLMGMDEDYESFIQLLSSEPKIVVGDFDEDKLGLLRLYQSQPGYGGEGNIVEPLEI